MFNPKTFAIAAIVAASLPGAAEAAIVNYGIGATDGLGQDYVSNCDGFYNCTSNVVSVSGLTFSANIALNTAAGMVQNGNPQGGVGTTFLFGGSTFGQPSGGSFSFSSSAPQAAAIGPTNMPYRSVFYGQTNNMQFTLEDQLVTQSIDALTGDTILISSGIFLTTAMYGGGGGIMNVDGVWVPNPSTTTDGAFRLSISQYIERYNSNGDLVSLSVSIRDWTSNAARFFNASTPVPEPGAIGFLGLGLLALAARRRRRVA